MTEFITIVNIKKRMCDTHAYCKKCPLSQDYNGRDIPCCDLIYKHPEEAERIILQWAAEHPEPQYPSWSEAWKRLFPGAFNAPCPNMYFGLPCRSNDCDKCRAQPIPAHIAQMLHIQSTVKEATK